MQAKSRLLHIQFSCLLLHVSLVILAAVAVEASPRHGTHGDGGDETSDSAAEDPAFLDAFQFFHTKLRLTGETGGVGLYYDKYIVSRGKSVGINMGSVGPGMISVCIGEALGLISRDEAIRLTLETLESLLGERPDFKPTRSPRTGFFGHFLNPRTGVSHSEISTIDTALMAAGAMFARNYLKDPTVDTKTNLLVQGIEWGAAMREGDNHMSMVIDPVTGDADWTKLTHPFNEYYVLACVGKVVEEEMGITNGNATAYFNRYFTDPPQSMKDAGAVIKHYGKYNTWAALRGRFASSFEVQLCFYLSKFFQTVPDYHTFFVDSAGADWLFFRNKLSDPANQDLVTDFSPYQWGCGQGSYPAGGYYATAIEDNDELVYSTPTMAGFFPADEEIGKMETALKELYDNNVCTYDVDDFKVLFRCSLKQKDWRSPYIESFAFSPFLLGYAWKLIGPEFFSENAI